MPRVSEEHLVRRRQQILDAALECFARKGFHATSMQDVFAESGLSAGAVYRYFKSKDDLIAALAADATTLVGGAMDEIVHRDPLPTPGEVIAALTTEVIAIDQHSGRVRLAPQAWGLAVTDPAARAYVSTAILSLRDRWRAYAERMREAGWLPADADIDAVAKTLLGIMPGFLLQHVLIGDIEPRTLAHGLDLLLPQYRHTPA